MHMTEQITDAALRKQVAQWTRIALGDLREEIGALSEAVSHVEQPSTLIPMFMEYYKCEMPFELDCLLGIVDNVLRKAESSKAGYPSQSTSSLYADQLLPCL
jgi:hypothetical protein